MASAIGTEKQGHVYFFKRFGCSRRAAIEANGKFKVSPVLSKIGQ
jgi:hypothetical protein